MLALALLMLSAAIPQPDLRIAFFVAAFLVSGFALFEFLKGRKTEPEWVDDDKHIILFRKPEPLDEHSVACPHCGEVYGLGIETCPRCRRTFASHG